MARTRPLIFGAQIYRFALILHPIGKPIHLECLKKMT